MTTKAYSYARWSSGRQREGHSLERQIEAARRYAAKRGLDLDTSMVDDAVSAYRGKNRLKGALANFKTAIEQGRIPVGSYFLIDSYDRFSREKTNIAVQSLLEIVNAGVNVVTLANEYVFSRDGDAVTNLLLATVELDRAHRESEEKGRKVKEAHAKSKRLAREEGKAWTPIGTSWLNVIVEGAGRNRKITYEPIPERVALIQEMFDLFEGGMTSTAIARAFNDRGVLTNYQFERLKKPTRLNGEERVRKDSGEWSADMIKTVLSNRAVLGERQQMVTDPNARRGRRPDGEPVEGFYPAVIDEAQFLRVQAKLAEKKRAPRVRGSVTYNNLFIQLGVCGGCGKTFSLHANTNSDSRTRMPRLRCVAAKTGGRCTNTLRMPYPPLEAAFLNHVSDFEVPNARPSTFALSQDLLAAEGRNSELQAKIDRWGDELGKKESRSIRALLDNAEAEQDTLNARIAELKALVGSAATQPKPTDHIANIATLRERLDTTEGEALYALRANIAQNIRAVVEKMVFNADGTVMVFVKGLEAFYLFKNGEFLGKAPDGVTRLVRKAADAAGEADPGKLITRTGEGSTQFVIGWAKRLTA